MHELKKSQDTAAVLLEKFLDVVVARNEVGCAAKTGAENGRWESVSVRARLHAQIVAGTNSRSCQGRGY